MFLFKHLFLAWIVSLLVKMCFAKSLKSPRIIIIGAGLSGISAGAKLLENNFENILILEAEDRIGGRIHSVPFSNGLIDLGGQWIHGATNNVVYDLVHDYFQFGDTGVDSTPPIFLNSTGKPIKHKQVVKLAELARKVLTLYPEMAKFNGSLGSFFIKRFARALKSIKLTKTQMGIAIQIIDFYHKEINTLNGSETWFDISARLNAISGVNDGNQFLTWKDKGYITVFDFLTVSLTFFDMTN